MFINFYTSRVVLAALGVEDFGIYNVVGGIVAMLGFLNGTLSTASSRYITVALSDDDILYRQKVFSSVLTVNIILVFIILLISESVGLWFLKSKMVIPDSRLFAAQCVFHLSVLTVVLNIVSVPYNATIIAHEKMKAFAYISIFDGCAKLLISYLIMLDLTSDRLILYALLLFLVQFIDRLIYGRYCLKNFPESKFVFYFNKNMIRNIFGFISWSAYGSLASVCFNYGLNILLNIFFGPVVNAARGISVQVQHAMTAFNTNFHMAFNPQLIKSVAKQELFEAKSLLVTSARFSFYLLCFLCLPIIAETSYVLTIWLKNVPEYTVTFVRIMLTISIWQSLANSLRVVNQAEGNIRRFQVLEGSYLLLIVPIAFCGLKCGLPAYFVFIVHLFVEFSANFIRISIVLPKVDMTIKEYVSKIYLRVILVYTVPLIVPIFTSFYMVESFSRFVLTSVLIEFIVLVLVYSVGIDNCERTQLRSFFLKKIRRL